MILSTLYPIIDFTCFSGRQDPLHEMLHFAEQLLAAGATIIQYRDKVSDPQTFLHYARELCRITQGRATFIVNDRTDLALACDADGVHLGQDDLSPVAARRVLDAASPGKSRRVVHPFAGNPNTPSAGSSERVGDNNLRLLIGFSTHNIAQVREADSFPVDYIAVGPIFGTVSKANPDPVVGLEGLRQARAVTQKPLVAIGGITRATCRQVRDAGADSVAVISDLLESPAKAVEAFLCILG